MKIAVIGGGAAGMAAAYYLNKQGHYVGLFERQPMLGGNIRTLNKNVRPSHTECVEILESGPLEFPNTFHNFVALMNELDVKLLPVAVGSGLFTESGTRFLSGVASNRNAKGMQRIIEQLRFNAVNLQSVGLWLKVRAASSAVFHNQPLSQHLKEDLVSHLWLKLLTMYSYSIPLEYIDEVPAELALPMLRDYLSVKWLRVEGGVYSYIEKIVERFKGDIFTNVEIANIYRSADTVKIESADSEIHEFDKVVFATPPDQVLTMLADPDDVERKRFSPWKGNHITTVVHRDRSMYSSYGVRHPSEFDFVQSNHRWGYNCYLNQLCGVSSLEKYILSFQLEDNIQEDKIIHVQKQHTPFYTTEAFQHRNEIIETNGESNTYYAGAYLGDGLHEGAISSAVKVARLIG